MELERTQLLRDGSSCLRVCVSFVLVAAALAVGGCSGGASETEPSQLLSTSHAGSTGPLPSGDPPSPSQARLIARADAICRQLNTEIIATKLANLSAREIARGVPRNAALEQRALTELSKLRPPASIARSWRQVIAYRTTLMEELVKLGRDAKANDAAGIQTLTASKKRVHGELSTTARRAGFKDCSQVG